MTVAAPPTTRGALFWTATLLSCGVAALLSIALGVATFVALGVTSSGELALVILLAAFAGAFGMLRRGLRPFREYRASPDTARADTGVEQWLRAVGLTAMLSSAFFVVACTGVEVVIVASALH